MSKIILVANRVDKLVYESNCDYMGVDAGSIFCLEHNIPMVCAVGDFDSINNEQFEQLKKKTNVIKLPAEKDDVDSEFALSHAKQLGYDDIELYGVMGGRQDHFLAVYQLLRSGEVPFVMKDENNIIYRLEAGTYSLRKRMRYLSFFACEDLMITVSGVKYPLRKRMITEKDVYLVSNEIIDESADLQISGRIIVIESNSL